MQNKQFLLFFVMSISALLFSYEAYAKKGGGGGRNRTDTTPSQFSFVGQTNVALNSLINSNTVTITGINVATSVSISGGEYSLNGGASFTTAASSLLNNGFPSKPGQN